MALAQWQRLSLLLPIYGVSLFYALMVLLTMLKNILIMGPRRYFGIKKRTVRPTILDSPEWGTHGYARLKDVTIHYVSKGDEDKPLMLFLHGFPEFWFSWRHQLVEFSRDYSAVAIDLRGYADSSKPNGATQYTIDKITGDVRNFIAYLGYDKCILAGHDWGGNIAWSFSMMYPHIVEHLIICNIGHPHAFQKHYMKSWSQKKRSWYIIFFQMPVLPEVFSGVNDLAMIDFSLCSSDCGAKPGTWSAEEIEAYKYTFQRYGDRTGPINYYRAAVRYRAPLIPSPVVKAKTLVIWGTKDAFLEREMAETSRNFAQDYTLRYIDGASHWVNSEEPEKVNEYIREFINRDKDYEINANL